MLMATMKMKQCIRADKYFPGENMACMDIDLDVVMNHTVLNITFDFIRDIVLNINNAYSVLKGNAIIEAEY